MKTIMRRGFAPGRRGQPHFRRLRRENRDSPRERFMRRGFTLIELLVVITIIGVLIGMALPALQATREAAHRLTCINHLSRIGLALQNYESAQEVLPPGTIDAKGPIHSVPQGDHMGWLVQLLPYVEEGNTFKHVDFAGGAYSDKNAPLRALCIPLFTCPSAPWVRSATLAKSDYAGCHNDVEAPIDVNNHGVLFLNSHVSAQDVTNGAANTIYVGEKLAASDDLGWMSGTRATLRNTGSPLDHPMGATTKLALAAKLAAAPQAPAKKPLGARRPRPGKRPAAAEKPAVAATAPAPPARPATASDLQVGGFGSAHPAVSNFLFGDGAVRSLNDDIDLNLLEQLGNRASGKLLTDGPTRQR